MSWHGRIVKRSRNAQRMLRKMARADTRRTLRGILYFTRKIVRERATRKEIDWGKPVGTEVW